MRTRAILLAAAMLAGPTARQPDPPQGEVLVRIETAFGNIDLAIDVKRAPITAGNFLKYVDGGFYDGGRFHRATRADNYKPNLPNRPLLEIIQGDISPTRAAERFPAIPLERTSVTGLSHVVRYCLDATRQRGRLGAFGLRHSPERSTLAEPWRHEVRRRAGHGGIRPRGRGPGCGADHSAAARRRPEPRSAHRDQEGISHRFARAVVVFETQKGTIEIEVDTHRAPITAANFLKYVDGGFYDGGTVNRAVRADNTVRHDVKIEVIQFQIDAARRRLQFPPIPLERTSVTGLKHVDGAVSMARSGPDTATASFSIVIGDQPRWITAASGTRMARGSPCSAASSVAGMSCGLSSCRRRARAALTGRRLSTHRSES